MKKIKKKNAFLGTLSAIVGIGSTLANLGMQSAQNAEAERQQELNELAITEQNNRELSLNMGNKIQNNTNLIDSIKQQLQGFKLGGKRIVKKNLNRFK